MTRVGDRERERAETALRQHFLAGRLTEVELSERLGAVLRARSRHELRSALAELPAAWRQLDDVVVPALERARRTLRTTAYFLVWLVASVFLLFSFATWLATEGASTFGLVAFPVAWLVVSVLLYRRAGGRRGPRRRSA